MKTLIIREKGERLVLMPVEEVSKSMKWEYHAMRQNRIRYHARKIEGAYYFNYYDLPKRIQDKFSLAELVNPIKPKAQVAEIMSEKLKSAVAQGIDHALVSRYMHGCRLRAEDALQLAESKAWLDRLLALTGGGNAHILFGFDKIGDVLEVAAKVLAAKKLYGLRITGVATLRQKLRAYEAVLAENRADWLIPKWRENQNAAVIGKQMLVHPETGEIMPFDTHLAIIYALYLNTGKGNKLFKKTIHEQYTEEMQRLGLEALSYQTVCRRTGQFNMKAIMSRERDGNKHFNDNYLPYVSAERLQLSNTMWVGDGSSVKLLYRAANGAARSLMCYRIFDVATRRLLGYHLYEGGNGQKGESEEVILAALKMAYQNAGVFACELVTDNGGAHSKAEFVQKMKLCFQKYTHITKGNSQENYAESIIKIMNNTARYFDNFGGSSWGAKTVESQANYDHIKTAELPSREEAYAQAVELLQRYNAEIRADDLSPDERYEINKNTRARAIDERTNRFVFGAKTQKDISAGRGFVNINRAGKTLKYTIADYETTIDLLAQKTGYKGSVGVNLYFDENVCDVYTLEDEFIVSCEKTAKTHKSEFETVEGGWGNLSRLRERKKKMLARTEKHTENVQNSRDAVLCYRQIAMGKNAAKDEWEEYNLSQLPLNADIDFFGGETAAETAPEEAFVFAEKSETLSVAERARRELFYGKNGTI